MTSETRRQDIWTASCRRKRRHENGVGGGSGGRPYSSSAGASFFFGAGGSNATRRPASTRSMGTGMPAALHAADRRLIFARTLRSRGASGDASPNSSCASGPFRRALLVQWLMAFCTVGRFKSDWKSASSASWPRTPSTAATRSRSLAGSFSSLRRPSDHAAGASGVGPSSSLRRGGSFSARLSFSSMALCDASSFSINSSRFFSRFAFRSSSVNFQSSSSEDSSLSPILSNLL